MDKIKIVIADDNSFIREGLKIILSSYEEVCVKFFSIRFKYRDSKTLFLYTFVWIDNGGVDAREIHSLSAGGPASLLARTSLRGLSWPAFPAGVS